jgi:predicted small integral membrane protein
MTMDTTFPGNRLIWRAIYTPEIYHVFYIIIILWETLITLFCFKGVIDLLKARHSSNKDFYNAKKYGIIGLAQGLILWLLGFIIIAGEWFMMWQSLEWNVQEVAFRLFAMTSVIFVIFIIKEDQGSK